MCQSHRAIYQIKRRKNKLREYLQGTELPQLPRNASIQKYRIFKKSELGTYYGFLVDRGQRGCSPRAGGGRADDYFPCH